MELTVRRKWYTKTSTAGELSGDGIYECFDMEPRQDQSQGKPLAARARGQVGSLSVGEIGRIRIYKFLRLFGQIVDRVDGIGGTNWDTSSAIDAAGWVDV
jgi:hypothetical protein